MERNDDGRVQSREASLASRYEQIDTERADTSELSSIWRARATHRAADRPGRLRRGGHDGGERRSGGRGEMIGLEVGSHAVHVADRGRGSCRRARGSRCARCGSASGRSSARRCVGRSAAASAPPIVGPPPTGGTQVDRPMRGSLLVAQSAWPKSPKCATRSPPRSKTKIVLGPRCVPATVVVLGGDRDDLADRATRACRRSSAASARIAADRVDAVVVAVLVGDEQQVGLRRRRSAGSRSACRGRRCAVMSPNGIDERRRLGRR